MAIRYILNLRARLVTTVVEDCATLLEGLRHCRALRADPGFNPFFSEIVDLSNLTTSDLSFNSLNVLADPRVGDPFSRHALRAVIAPSELAQCLAQMYRAAHARQQQIVLSDSHIRIFEKLADAKEYVVHNAFFPVGKIPIAAQPAAF